MIDDKDRESRERFEEFVKFCDEFLEKAKCEKKDLADKLGMDPTTFSKHYNGHRPVSPELLEAVRRLAASQPIVKRMPIANQQELPLDVSKIREEIARIQAVQDSNDKRLTEENRELRERVAVLEKLLEQASADSEKKIKRLIAEAIRDEAERIADRLPPHRREATG